MVFDIITATALCPAIIATKQAIDGGSKGNQRAGNKSINQELYVRFPGGHPYRRKFEGARVVLMNGKLYVEHADSHFAHNSIHPACGRFQSSPEYSAAWAKVGHKGDCLTTTTPSSTPSSSPSLIYVDLTTHELKYGPPEEAEDHYPGPWSCTEIEHRVLFEGWEGWVVVQEDAEKDLWALYFDRSDDGLTGEGKVGDFETTGVQMRMLYVRLARREEPRTIGKHEQEKAEGKKKKEELELDDDKSLL
ncbi:hypothetical protein L198_03484 [Cryptococcus wingfieldii CBS 7118]|uniref:Uncharacterized protein n=1 Tax=Cryptococcus wingfieldii CBS 7118 TaxID=1295528 RepID=A0A1E3JBM3_9TREE|nr:hypothetical protein L198_03484 [Cryptococcus wingfieldii CBS 7118]ODN98242.1 hypothetical protein L198_03484 [Cryptococcus wingfieldii CBS 7118]